MVGPERRKTRLNARHTMQAPTSSLPTYPTLLIDTMPVVRDRSDAKDIQVEHGEIVLKDVGFGYSEGHAALMGVSLEVPAGKTAALVSRNHCAG